MWHRGDHNPARFQPRSGRDPELSHDPVTSSGYLRTKTLWWCPFDLFPPMTPFWRPPGSRRQIARLMASLAQYINLRLVACERHVRVCQAQGLGDEWRACELTSLDGGWTSIRRMTNGYLNAMTHGLTGNSTEMWATHTPDLYVNLKPDYPVFRPWTVPRIPFSLPAPRLTCLPVYSDLTVLTLPACPPITDYPACSLLRVMLEYNPKWPTQGTSTVYQMH